MTEQLGFHFDTQHTLLISLKPQFFDAIIKGEKDVEFRKTWPGPMPTKVFVYVMKPVAQIKIMLDLAPPTKDPKDLDGRNGLGVDDFLAGRKPGRWALPIKKVHILKDPLPLTDLMNEGVAPPQGYVYLDRNPKLLNRLQALLP
jgi:predicted transcriptional regulator